MMPEWASRSQRQSRWWQHKGQSAGKWGRQGQMRVWWGSWMQGVRKSLPVRLMCGVIMPQAVEKPFARLGGAKAIRVPGSRPLGC
jgi:hypothetical protein